MKFVRMCGGWAALAIVVSAVLGFSPAAHAVQPVVSNSQKLPLKAGNAPSPKVVGSASLSSAGKRAKAHPNRAPQTVRRSGPVKIVALKSRPKFAANRVGLRRATYAPPRPSHGSLHGLQNADDPLALKSSAALVVDQDTGEVLFSKNERAVLPVASLTKLMTALVVLEAKQSLHETLVVTDDAFDTEKRSRSRLALGATLTRIELLHLALMASENRSAHTLGANYPGGPKAFVAAMNQRAQTLGMTQSNFVEPTGLSSRNQSSARDLALLVQAAYKHRTIRDLSTSNGLDVAVHDRAIHFGNTNLLVASPTWDIGLQKTGYIAEAGRCLVMQAKLAGRKLVMVFLDSAGKYSRLGDAERVRRWLTEPDTPAVLDAGLVSLSGRRLPAHRVRLVATSG